MIDIITWLIVALLFMNGILLVVQIWLSGSGAKNTEKAVREQLDAGRQESAESVRELREQVSAVDSMVKIVGEMGDQRSSEFETVTSQLKDMSDTYQSRVDTLRQTFDSQLKQLQKGSETKLEEMFKAVDENLHNTLEANLSESFDAVYDRLEAVQRGLGDMHGLATGVGDLKKMLTNVRARGTWGEIQLEALLEQILTPDQYDSNVQIKDETPDAVEYAIRLPGGNNQKDSFVWLPIDSKFPQEDYVRFQLAVDTVDAAGVQTATAALVNSARNTAQEIRDKYINPPKTTDFAIMFLPMEGLYAEIFRQPGLIEDLQRTYRVVVSGPATLGAILNSLRMGFRTLAIEQRASEVWQVLAAVKTEFSKFGETLGKVKRELDAASRTIEETGARTRSMENQLQGVEALPAELAEEVLKIPAGESITDAETTGGPTNEATNDAEMLKFSADKSFSQSTDDLKIPTNETSTDAQAPEIPTSEESDKESGSLKFKE
jgi:DNA recombination protein RmuC